MGKNSPQPPAWGGGQNQGDNLGGYMPGSSMGSPDPQGSMGSSDPFDPAKKQGPMPPAPPNYFGAAGQDYRNQGNSNRPNINTPFASENWTQGPDGRWQLNTALGADVENAYKNMPPVDWGSLPQVETGEKARDEATTAAYNQSTSRLDPQWAHNDEAMRAQLANQGLDPNSEANRGATLQESNAKNDAYSGARNSAIEQGREAGNDVFHNSLMTRQNALAEALRKHGLGMEDLGALQGFMGMPGFNQTNSNFLGAAGQEGGYNLNAWLARLQAMSQGQKNTSDTIGSIGGILAELAKAYLESGAGA